MDEQRIREIIREEIGAFNKIDRFTFYKLVQMLDGRSIQTGLTTGTTIGTAAAQKVSLHGATPTIQSLKINDPTAAGATYLQATAQSSVDKIKEIINALEAKGITSAT